MTRKVPTRTISAAEYDARTAVLRRQLAAARAVEPAPAHTCCAVCRGDVVGPTTDMDGCAFVCGCACEACDLEQADYPEDFGRVWGSDGPI